MGYPIHADGFQYAVDFDGDGKRDIWNSILTVRFDANSPKSQGWMALRSGDIANCRKASLHPKADGAADRGLDEAWRAAGARRSRKEARRPQPSSCCRRG
jgi:membrane-bound lytic murein transglycosylase B